MRRTIVVLVLSVVLVLLAACTPEQVMWSLAHKGDRTAQEDWHSYTHRQPVSPDRWQRYVRLSTDLTAWRNSEAGRNAAADYAARHSGSPGTCTPTGIFYAESGGNWYAQNPTSSASGGFQFIDGTWAGYGGYARAVHAPPWVQWEKFLSVWAGGAGRSHWAASVC